tara:strand:+ start:6670 stop:7425 length:756 start_codon:yes stop_codon:yes gene_type:complete
MTNDVTKAQAAMKSVLKGLEVLKEDDQRLTGLLSQLSVQDKNENKQANLIKQLSKNAELQRALVATIPLKMTYAADRVATSRGALVNQATVYGVMEQQLEQAKIGLGKVAGTQENKMRMVEVNTYYSDKYRAQTGLIKLIIIVSVAFLLVVILMKKNLIPNQVAVVLLIGVILIGGILVTMTYLNISSRDNMVFDEFNWNADPPSYDSGDAPAQGQEGAGFPCIDSSCCVEGTKFVKGTSSTDLNKCIAEV